MKVTAIESACVALRELNRGLHDLYGPEQHRRMRLQFMAREAARYGDLGYIVAQNVTSHADKDEE